MSDDPKRTSRPPRKPAAKKTSKTTKTTKTTKRASASRSSKAPAKAGRAPKPAAPEPAPRPSGDARVMDRGYRRYDGPRRSVQASTMSLAINSLQRALGLRRSAATKILPVITTLIAYLPAVAFVGMAALLPPQVRGFLPAYHEYYGFVTAAIFLYAALVAPEILSADRRTRIIGLYYASPLTPYTYVAAKAAALMTVLAFVTLGPPLLLVLAYMLQGVGPDGFIEVVLAFARILIAGVVLSAIYGSVAMAVSSFTDRRAFASAGIILIVLVPNVVTNVLVQGFDAPGWVTLASLTSAPFEFVQRIYGQAGSHPEVHMLALAGGLAATVAGATALVLWRYSDPDTFT